MATLSAIRQALVTTVTDAVSVLHGYRNVQDVVNLPALVVVPATPATVFGTAMGRGLDTHTLSLYVLVSNREPNLAQDELDEFIAGSGAKSIRQAVWNNKYLGLDGTSANITEMTQYGAQFEVGGVQLVGAVLTASVTSLGTA